MKTVVRLASFLGIFLVAMFATDISKTAYGAPRRCDGNSRAGIPNPAAIVGEGCTQSEASENAVTQLVGGKGKLLHCNGTCPAGTKCSNTTNNMACVQVANPVHGAAGHVHCQPEVALKWQCTIPAVANPPGVNMFCSCLQN